LDSMDSGDRAWTG